MTASLASTSPEAVIGRIARIMLSWGLISMATMFVRMPEQFCLGE